jgi:V/A-type H+-transporting ATPase subunit I
LIEKMQKITLVCLSSEHETAVSSLQALGLFHVVPVNEPASEELHELSQRQSELERVLNVLAELSVKPEAASVKREPSEVLQRAIHIVWRLKEVSERQLVVLPAIEQLEPWGEFSETVLQQLEERGWHYALCRSADKLPQDLPGEAFCQVVQQSRGGLCFAVFSTESLSDLDLPLEKFPQGRDLRALRQELLALQEEEAALNEELRRIAACERENLRGYIEILQSRVDYAKARDGMGHSEQELAWLSGFVPQDNLPELLQAARKEGWGVRHEEAELEDPEVPTKLRIPKRLRMAQLIFDFIGVLPGYNEIDVSVPLLIFLSIFCGMLVGDAGYGLIFVALGCVLWFKNRQASQKKREGIMLLLLMSGCVLTFGALSGNWFGIPPERLPLFFRGIPWFRDDVNSNHVKLLGFVIGAFHLSMARVWAAIVSGNLRDGLGNVGWACFLWGNFFTVKMLLISGGELPQLAKVLYLVGTVLILTCSVNWRDMGDIIYMPFNFINSLVDVLSYIRLYAVGLSGYFIAKSFNSMSVMVWESSVWLIPLGLIIILLGHSLNVALATMGIMVHGIRLNTLEFSGHIGLSWGGKAYQPLKNAESNGE